MNELALDDTALRVLPLDVPHSPATYRRTALLRVRWLVLRYLRRYADRLVQASASWSDVAVGPDEFRRIAGLSGEALPRVALLDELNVPSIHDCERVVAATRRALDAAPGENPDIWLGPAAIADRFDLSGIELDLLLCAAAPRIDPDVARLYPFAWSDFSIRQPTASFLAELVAPERDDVDAVMAHLQDDAALMRSRLLVAGEHERWKPATPRLHAPIIVPSRIVEALIAPAVPGTRILGAHHRTDGLDDDALILDDTLRTALRRHLEQPRPRVMLVGPPGSGRRTVVQSMVYQAGGTLLEVDVGQALAATGEPFEHLLGDALREARLLAATLLLRLDDVDANDALVASVRKRNRILDTLVEAHPGAVVFAVHPRSVDALAPWLGDTPNLELRPPPPSGQVQLWTRALEATMPEERVERVAAQLGETFQLTPGAIARAVEVANDHHARAGHDLGTLPPNVLVETVQRRMSHNLGWLADTLVVDMTLDEVVFSHEVRAQIDEVLMFARHAYRVMNEWGLGEKSHGGIGLSVLFSGPPGTGKTLTAAVLGRELGRLVYRVDLSSVVDKYIGETEKNLGRIFDEAERAQAILLFDEADSLFAKRTSVKSSNDRYANLEVNYLLQRLEGYGGVCILTTNFATSIDEAFQRRLRFKIEFESPDVEAREQLWRTLMPSHAPCVDDIDWESLAYEFEFTGGHIRNAIMRACIRAADLDKPVDTDILYDASVAESRELGLLVRSEF